MTAANAANIDQATLAFVSGFLLEAGNPVGDGVENIAHAANGILFFVADGKSGVDVISASADPNPHRAVVSENNLHVGGLAQDAHVGQDAVIDHVVRAGAVAAILLADKFIRPLRFFDFAADGSDEHVAIELDASALDGFNRLGVADQRAFHVVNAEAVDKGFIAGPIFEDGFGLV